MKKVLIISTIIDFLATFEISNVKILQSMECEVHCACNYNMNAGKIKLIELMDTGVINHHIPFERSPFSTTNITAWKMLKKLMKDERFDLVHCHTPLGGVLGRAAAYRNHVPMIMYTAHGFHFYKGASVLNWLLYYPIEWLLSYWTDVLITINKEDYMYAKKNLGARKTIYVPGVGIDIEKWSHVQFDMKEKRKELGITSESIMLLSVGELNENKNHRMVIKILGKLKERDDKCLGDLHYFIAGQGILHNELIELADSLGVNLHLLGFRNDILELLTTADAFVLPSIREGLNVSLMEAMASGKPCIVSKIRGNVELIDEGKGGWLVAGDGLAEYAELIDCIKQGKSNLYNMGEYNRKKIRAFDLVHVRKQMEELYKECL